MTVTRTPLPSRRRNGPRTSMPSSGSARCVRDARNVAWLVVRQTFSATVAGVVAGAIGGTLFARLLTSQFYGVTKRNPWIYLAVLALITLAASFASLAPVFFAAHIDPAESLRQE